MSRKYQTVDAICRCGRRSQIVRPAYLKNIAKNGDYRCLKCASSAAGKAGKYAEHVGTTSGAVTIPTNLRSVLGAAAELLLDESWLRTQRLQLGLSTRQIAKLAGCGKKAAGTALRRFGISAAAAVRRDSSRNLLCRRPDLDGTVNNRDWLYAKYVTANLSQLEIANEVGLSKKCVGDWVRRLRISKDAWLVAMCSKESYRRKNGFEFDSDEAHRRRMTGRRGHDILTAKGGLVRCHSGWEREFATYLDGCEAVTSFKKDAVRVPYTFDGKNRSYFPDFLIVLASGKHLIAEVKPTAMLAKPMNVAKIAALREFCESLGSQMLLVTGTRRVELPDLTGD